MSQTPDTSHHIVRTVAPAREQTIKALRAAIAHAELLPGQRIREREMSERLGVSRTTLREALRQLEADGLVSGVPGKGTIVSVATIEQGLQLYEVWQALLTVAVTRLAQRADDASIGDLELELGKLTDAYSSGDRASSLAAKSNFYEALYRNAGNSILAEMAMGVQTRLISLRYYSLAIENRAAVSLAEVRDLVAAIQAKQSERAAKLVQTHIENARDAALIAISDESSGKVTIAQRSLGSSPPPPEGSSI